jgi:hypothetical protein
MSSGKKPFVWKSLFALVALFVGIESSFALVDKRIRGGDHLPVPFKGANTRVELAIGEHYILAGFVIVTPRGAYLEVDLKVHPWLANKARVEFPYYPIEGGTLALWRKHQDDLVELPCVAVRMVDGSIGLLVSPQDRKNVRPLGSTSSSRPLSE